MKSMTGYGKSSFIDDNYEIQIEIKSVNYKSFDLKIMNYKELFFLENELKEIVFNRIKRGKIEVRISFRDKQIPQIEVDDNRLQAYHQMLVKIKESLQIKDEISLDTIVNQPDVVIINKSEYDTTEFRQIFFSCLNEAIARHQELAEKEGASLKKFFLESFQIIEDCLAEIKETIPTHKEKLKEKLVNEVKLILNTGYNEDVEKRILIETALYLERCDITEELIRMESHLANIKSFMGQTPGTWHPASDIGKSMSFILQEMQREVNTISAKYNTSNTFISVLKMKEEVDKCREQIQNVE